jgi:hypothetical protein
MKAEKEGKMRAKAPNKALNAKPKKELPKAFYDLRDIIFHLVNLPDDEPENLEYEIEISQYKDKLGLQDGKNAYTKIRRLGKQALESSPVLDMYFKDGGWSSFHVFQEINWQPNKSGIMTVLLTKRFKEVLINEKNGMTFYNISETLPMKSKYSKIMYPRLIGRMNQKKIEFKASGSLQGEYFNFYETVENFREVVGMPENYRIDKIKEVCKKIIKDIEECTGYKAEVYYNLAHINGATKHKTTHIAWKLKKKSGDIIDSDFEVISDHEKEIPGQISIDDLQMIAQVKEITESKLDDNSILSIVNNAKRHARELALVTDICKRCMETPGIKNLGGAINAAVTRGGFSPNVETEKNKAADTQFNNFHQRDYDYADLEKKLRNK